MDSEHTEHTSGEHDCMICHVKCEEGGTKKFQCDHKQFHEECINNRLKVGKNCPYCRAPVNSNNNIIRRSTINRYNIINQINEETLNPSIYIWHDWQTLGALSYRDSWNLNFEIKVIDQNNILDLYNNDIVYHHS